MQESITSQLVADALMMAAWHRGKAMTRLHHSDQGSQGGLNQWSRHLQKRIVCGATHELNEAFQIILRKFNS